MIKIFEVARVIQGSVHANGTHLQNVTSMSSVSDQSGYVSDCRAGYKPLVFEEEIL